MSFNNMTVPCIFLKLFASLGQEQNSLTWLAAAYNNMGMVYDSKGDLSNAFDHYIEALQLFEQKEDLVNAAIVLNNLGIINLNLVNMKNQSNISSVLRR
jgi:tetratricopeptide (TPR) repeat protein